MLAVTQQMLRGEQLPPSANMIGFHPPLVWTAGAALRDTAICTRGMTPMQPHGQTPRMSVSSGRVSDPHPFHADPDHGSKIFADLDLGFKIFAYPNPWLDSPPKKN